MEKGKLIAYAIVLGPAILSFIVMLIAELGAKLKEAIESKLNDEHITDLLKEMTAHAAFYGSAIAGFLGHKNDSFIFYVVCVLWFIICIYLAYVLAMKSKLLKESKNHV